MFLALSYQFHCSTKVKGLWLFNYWDPWPMEYNLAVPFIFVSEIINDIEQSPYSKANIPSATQEFPRLFRNQHDRTHKPQHHVHALSQMNTIHSLPLQFSTGFSIDECFYWKSLETSSINSPLPGSVSIQHNSNFWTGLFVWTGHYSEYVLLHFKYENFAELSGGRTEITF
jgi:hypothetical protein